MSKKAATRKGGVTEEEDLSRENEEIEDEEIENDDEDDNEEVEPAKNPRDIYREQLAKRHQETRKEDLGVSEETDDDDEEDAEDDDSEEAQKVEEEEDTDDDTEEEVKASKKKKKPETFFTIKIDGEEKQVTEAELIKGYQLEATARKRYSEATATKKIAEEKKRLLEERLAELEKQRGKDFNSFTKETEFTPKDNSELDFSELVVKIREGSDEDAKEALESLYSKVSKASSLEDVESLVEKKLRAQQEAAEQQRLLEQKAQAEAAAEVFKTTFEKDMQQHPRFWDLAIMEDNALENDPDWQDKSFIDRYLEAGNRAKKWFEKNEPETTKSAKAKRKVISGHTARAKLKEEPKPRTTSDIIFQIKKARGQV